MHTGPMQDSDGDFEKSKPADGVRCHRCKEQRVTMQVWHSKCGGYEDDKYSCAECGYTWWVEGPDA